MWNAMGIWMWIMYVVFSLAVAIVSLSIYIDIARAGNSKNDKKVAFYENAFLKTTAMIFIVIVWLILLINVRLREEAHDFGISDKQCIALSAESGWSESDVRDYLTITAKNGGSIEAAIAHIKGEE